MTNTMETPRPKSTIRVTPLITAWELLRQIRAGDAVAIVDVRDAALFHPRHILRSVNAPDSQTTALVKKLQILGRAVLVCNDGRQSSMVARTLGFCNFTNVAALDGGLAAWVKVGGPMAETTRSGFEKELPPEGDETSQEKPGFAAALFSTLLGRR